MSEKPTTAKAAPATRDRLAIALDVDDLVAATRLARAVATHIAVAKVGLELFSAAGPEAVGALRDLGFRVFLDVKLHDIPTTVHRAARVLGSLGAEFVTLHATGGEAMLRAGVEGLMAGASAAGLPEPMALAVTVLTSDAGAPPHILPKRLLAAVEAGCRGVVCAVGDVREAKQYAPRMFTVTPGIRSSGATAHDQARAGTARDAIMAGSDLLVLGRAVTAVSDPAAAAAGLAESFADLVG